MHSVRHLELFSGIGGFRRAFDCLSLDRGFVAECIGFSEIDDSATKVYKNFFDTEDEYEIGDIVKFTENEEKIN